MPMRGGGVHNGDKDSNSTAELWGRVLHLQRVTRTVIGLGLQVKLSDYQLAA